MQTKFIYVDTDKKLKTMCSELKKEDTIGVDLECENGLHHYGTFLALIQISSRKNNWIVDPILIEDLSPFTKILESKKITKIFHDISFDFRILNSIGCKPNQVFDTQLAAYFLGEEHVGLGDLLEKNYDVQKEKKFQMADWTKRPISEDMLSYAVKDSLYLIKLKELYEKELKKLNRLEWVEQEFRHNESLNWLLPKQDYCDLKGYRGLSDTDRAVLKRLFKVRETIAKKVDKPVYFVINTKKLIELAKLKPSFGAWKNMRGVHPAVRKFSTKLFDEQEKGKKEKIEVKYVKPKRMNAKQKKLEDTMTNIRNAVSLELNIQPHLIASKDQLRSYAITEKKEVFRSWQQELLQL